MKAPKQQEYGRTMVEMLASLSIMGLLSVGVIWAVESVIKNFHISSLSEEISARAMYASSKFKSQSKNQVVFKKFKHDYALGQFENSTTLVNNTFTIVINQIKDDICQKVKKRFEEQNTAALFICNSEEQKALITFYKSLKPTSNNPIVPCNSNDVCGACEVCGEYGFCESGCASGTECARAFNNPSNKSCCNSDLVVGGVCCSSVTYDEATGEKLCCGYNSASAGCCPAGHFAYSNKCYSCDEPKDIRVIQANYCKICPQRSMIGHMCVLECPEWDQINQNNRCYCPDDRPVQTTDGKCYSCDERPSQGVWGSETTLLLKDSGWNPSVMDVCGSAAYCGNYTCNGGYIRPCAEGQIGSEWSNRYNFKLKDGTTPTSSQCYDCSDVRISSIKVESQCNICGGTWSGENWYKGTCTPPAEYVQCTSENECTEYNPDTNSCEDMCQQVEYLESTGTQYIDTGVVPQYDFKFETKILIKTVSDDYFSSCRIDGGNTRFYALNMNSSVGFATSASSWGGTGYANYMPSNFLNTPHEITSNIQQDKVSLSVDGVLVEKVNTVSTISNQSLPLFGAKLNNSTNATAYSKSGTRCYYAKYYLGGSLVRDFIPVISPTGEPCMFDQVSKKLFYNKGSGTFKTNLDE